MTIKPHRSSVYYTCVCPTLVGVLLPSGRAPHVCISPSYKVSLACRCTSPLWKRCPHVCISPSYKVSLTCRCPSPLWKRCPHVCISPSYKVSLTCRCPSPLWKRCPHVCISPSYKACVSPHLIRCPSLVGVLLPSGRGAPLMCISPSYKVSLTCRCPSPLWKRCSSSRLSRTAEVKNRTLKKRILSTSSSRCALIGVFSSLQLTWALA